MLRLYKKLSKLDFIFVILIIGFTVLQVYFTMTIIDYVQGIVKAITYVNYHNNPGEISLELAEVVDSYGWDYVKTMDWPDSIKSLILNVADASKGDIWFNGGMMMALAGLSMLVQAIIAILASKVAADLSTNIRRDLYKHISGLSLAEIDKFQTASLVTRTTNDIQQIQLANLMTMRMIFQAPITAIWTICKINATSAELTATTAVALSIMLISIAFIMSITIPRFQNMQKLTDGLNRVTRDNLTGIRIVRAYNAEEYEKDKFELENNAFTKAQTFTGAAMGFLSPLMLVIMNGLTLAMYIIGSRLINKGTTDYATVTSFSMLGTQLVMAFVMLLMLFIMWPRAIVSAKRINEVLNTKTTVLDPKESKEFSEVGTIEFKNVSFGYNDAEKNVIENVSFRVEKGETLAIIGATSSGKTSLINLMARLYDVKSGSVLIDGVDVRDVYKRDLRDKIGFVPQKGFLFNGSIIENIAFGDDNIDNDKVKRAADIACASDFIEGFDEGYQYKISQGGKNVSGGQRQRLCIARCVYRSPEIYIFDDSFSALDYKTDKKVRENLSTLDKDSTKVIVAQRIGTIMDADKIIVLDDGKVVGYGNHESLLKDCEVYKEIALSQLSREELGL